MDKRTHLISKNVSPGDFKVVFQHLNLKISKLKDYKIMGGTVQE